jgi:hypothetical protein
MSFCHQNHFFIFRNEHAQSTTLGPKLMFGVLSQFRCGKSPIPKTGIGVHTKHEFLPLEPFLRFSQRTCPIHNFRSKTHVWGAFVQFCCHTSPIPKTVSGCIQSTSFCHRNHFFVFRNEHVQSTTLVPKLMFGLFLRNFVATRHPFRKRVSAAYKLSFCHRNHFFVFRDEHAQSTTLDPKLMFGIVSRNFVAARHPFRKRVSGCIQSTSFCHRNHFFIFRNEHAQSTTLGPKLMFGVLLCNFVAARHPFRKRVSRCIQSTSFCHRNHFFVFRNEHAHSTILGPKLMFRLISRNFVAARHPFRKRVSGAYKLSFCHRNHFFVFSQRTCPIHYFRSKTHVWDRFTKFRCRTSPIPKTGIRVHTKHELLPPEPFLRFLQRTCPIHYFRSKTHVWDGFTQFRCHTSPLLKTGIGVHTKHEFLPPEPFLHFSQRTCPIHYFRS